MKYYDFTKISSKLIIGYDTDPVDGDYWIIRGCRGTTWGEDGYMRLARNKNNHCGVGNWVKSCYCDCLEI